MLEARDLTLSIDGEARVNGIRLTLPPEGITVIMGPNGAGKSLLLRLLHGLIAPTAGSVHCDGEPLNAVHRSRQAMVFQRPVMLRRSVEANLMFALDRVKRTPPSSYNERGELVKHRLRTNADRCRAILAEIDLTDRARQPARALSGGEQQRLAVARALALEPETLFLDEPTASLDPAATLAIEAMITVAATQGTKVILVTHDIGQAKRLAADVAFLHQGRLAEHSTTVFTAPQSDQARGYLAGKIVL